MQRSVQYDFYTGPFGAQGKNGTASLVEGGVRFVTSNWMAPGEGLTVAVGFSKGAVTPPTAAEDVQNFFSANGSSIAGLVGLAAIAGYYVLAWMRFGRDPARGTIIPLFAPPKDFSAASVRFVDRMGYDRKTFAAALVAMAVKGYLKISEYDGVYMLIRTGKKETEAGLAKTEIALARTLFPSGLNTIELKNKNHTTVSRAINALRSSLKSIDEGTYFVTNRLWFFGGLAILVLSGLGATFLTDEPEPAIFMLIWVSGMDCRHFVPDPSRLADMGQRAQWPWLTHREPHRRGLDQPIRAPLRRRSRFRASTRSAKPCRTLRQAPCLRRACSPMSSTIC